MSVREEECGQRRAGCGEAGAVIWAVKLLFWELNTGKRPLQHSSTPAQSNTQRQRRMTSWISPSPFSDVSKRPPRTPCVPAPLALRCRLRAITRCQLVTPSRILRPARAAANFLCFWAAAFYRDRKSVTCSDKARKKKLSCRVGVSSMGQSNFHDAVKLLRPVASSRPPPTSWRDPSCE